MTKYVVVIALMAVVGAAWWYACPTTSLTEVRPDSEMPLVSYKDRMPGEYEWITTTEPAFGEGSMVDPKSPGIPENVRTFPFVVRMAFISQNAASNIPNYPADGGVLYIGCSNEIASVGDKVSFPKSLMKECNPGAFGFVTKDGVDAKWEGLWAAN